MSAKPASSPVPPPATQPAATRASWRMARPRLPLSLWMILLALGLGLASGMPGDQIVSEFNRGFGRALGEFALILLPSFLIAGALAQEAPRLSPHWAVGLGPLFGASMVCPDTAYAALAPLAGPQRLALSLGAYAGFKLLFPAGPLIVATALGAPSAGLILPGLLLFLPCWRAGLLWIRAQVPRGLGPQSSLAPVPPATSPAAGGQSLLGPLLPFGLLVFLMSLGLIAPGLIAGPAGFFFTVKGALLAAAALALARLPQSARPSVMDSALRRTALLLLMIGAASAFGTLLNDVTAFAGLVPITSGLWGLVGLFALTALFKLAQGSSMATFAAVGLVAAPLVEASGLPPLAAVYAICLGSFIAILPNDSFYLLVRRDALEAAGESQALRLLTGASLLQAFTGLAGLLGLFALGFF